jgi:predicted Zn-dependent protease
MRKIVLFFAIVFTFNACSLMQEKPVKANEIAFEGEDMYILFALRAEQVQEYNSAATLFEELYEKSSKKEYLYRSLENDLIAKNGERVIQRVDAFLLESPYDAKVVRYKVIALFELGELDKARDLGVALAAKTKDPKDYLLTSEIYIKRQEFDTAVKYLESAYAKEHSPEILDKMSIILYVNLGRKKEAIAHLETHSRIIGCEKEVCSRLAAFYSNDNNLDGLLSTYLRMYEKDKSENLTKKIVQIYAYKRDYKSLQKFLEESNSDDELLLQLYSSSKEYEKAYKLADKLYESSSDVNFLGQSAIFEYEAAKNKNDKILLKNVITKLEKVLDDREEPVYLNYLGYLLIDHDLDVKKGMKYIKQVLKLEPNSAFYIDSLAWGYYKLGDCKKAKELMDRVVKLEGGNENEVLEHVRTIDKCIKNENRR